MRGRSKADAKKKPLRFSSCDVCKRKSVAVNMKSCNRCDSIFCSSCETLTGGTYFGNDKTKWLCNVCSGKAPKTRNFKGNQFSPLYKKKSRIVAMNLVRPDGSWACAQCTYINSPSKRKCDICKARAPFSPVRSSLKRRRGGGRKDRESGRSNKKAKNAVLPASPIVQNNQSTLIAAVEFISKLKRCIYKGNQNCSVSVKVKNDMFKNVLKKLKVFSGWNDWPETLDLDNATIKTRLATIDTLQSSLRNHGILPLTKIEELMQDIFSFFPLDFSKLHKNRGGTSL